MGDEVISKADLPEDVVDYIEGLEGAVEDLTKAASEKDTEIEGLKTTLAEAEASSTVVKSEDEQYEALLAKADPAVRVMLERQREEIKKAQEVADAERDARLEREFISKAEALPMISENKSDLAGLLRRVHDALPAEDAAMVEKMLSDANTQIAKGNLFGEFGRSGQASTISKSVDTRAQEVLKAHPEWTIDQAKAHVYEIDPDLFAQAMTEER